MTGGHRAAPDGPFGDPAQRGEPCVADRCPHDAAVLLAGGLAALGSAARSARGGSP